MSKIPQEHIDKVCTTKHPYTSHKDAEQRIKAKKKKGYIISETLRIYKCRFCQWWHMGHIKTVDKKGNPV